MSASPFLFAICQPGSETLLKEEVDAAHPGLRFAYSRPGFLTFKANQDLTEAFDFKSTFARVWGLSLGRASTTELPDHDIVHRYSRDGTFPIVREGEAAKPGQRVLHRIIVEPAEPTDEWLGLHRQPAAGRWTIPAGDPQLILPPQAPSRAYQKLEEALLWCKAPLKVGQRAIDLGSAPGGASLLLVEKGLHVFGVDPAEMSPRVLGSRSFTHLKRGVQKLRPADFSAPPDWLVSDMNILPEETLRLIGPLARVCRGLLLTLKMHDESSARRIPSWCAAVREFGFRSVYTTQLPSNRSEIFLYASQRA